MITSSGTQKIALALTLLFSSISHAADTGIHLGSVAMDIPAEMINRLTPVTKYLSQKTGLSITYQASPNLSSTVDDLGSGKTKIAYLTPVAYLEAHEKYGVIPLVNPLTYGKATFNLVIVVRKDSKIKTMQDLIGKKFALGDEKALLQQAVIVRAGLKLENFSAHAFLKHYDNIAKAVINGDFDAGILKDTVADKFEPYGLRIIHVSPPLPSYLFAVSNQISPETIAKLKSAMLALNADTPENKAILSALDAGYDGFAAAEDKDYEIVRKLIAPFKNKK